jgi:hypothetical protein
MGLAVIRELGGGADVVEEGPSSWRQRDSRASHRCGTLGDQAICLGVHHFGSELWFACPTYRRWRRGPLPTN